MSRWSHTDRTANRLKMTSKTTLYAMFLIVAAEMAFCVHLFSCSSSTACSPRSTRASACPRESALSR